MKRIQTFDVGERQRQQDSIKITAGHPRQSLLEIADPVDLERAGRGLLCHHLEVAVETFVGIDEQDLDRTLLQEPRPLMSITNLRAPDHKQNGPHGVRAKVTPRPYRRPQEASHPDHLPSAPVDGH